MLIEYENNISRMQIFHLQHRKLNMIDYKTNYPISVKQFIELLNKKQRSGHAVR